MSVRKIIEIPGRPIAPYGGDTIGVEPGAGGGGGETDDDCGSPWSRTWFVDPGTTHLPADQTGSANCPFSTAQQAADNAGDGDAIVLGQGNAGDVTTDKSLSFFGLAATLEGNLSQLGTVTVDAAKLSFQNVEVQVVICTGDLTFNSSRVQPGGIECNSMVATETTFTFGDGANILLNVAPAKFRDCTFAVTTETNPEIQGQPAHFDAVSKHSFGGGNRDWKVTETPVDLETSNQIYGRGGDGNLNINAGVTATSDLQEWANITISGTASIDVSRNVLRVRDCLDLTAAPAAAIVGRGARDGGNAAGKAGGTAGTGDNGAGAQTSGALNGTAGVTGVNGAGAATAAPTAVRLTLGGGAGACGASGAGVAAGVASQAAPAGNQYSQQTYPPGVWTGPDVNQPQPPGTGSGTTLWTSQPGRAGSSGGGDNAAQPGGGGGGSGAGAYAVVIFARVIKIGPATPAGVILSRGFNGGNGGNGSAAGALATGGGAGAGGSGGGFIWIVYDWLIGDALNDQLSAPGGNGGAGGNGANGGGGGAGGTGGNGGQVLVDRLISQQRTRTTGTNGIAGNAAVGAAGGAGGAGGTCLAFI
jgi:hypothetical protein